MSDEQQRLLGHLVQVDEALLRFVLRRHAADAMYDVAGATRVRYDSGGELCDLVRVLIGAREPSQAGLTVGHDGRKRLVDLVRNRRRELSERCDPSGMREVGLQLP